MVHSLRWVTGNVFSSFLTMVNSLHHQCIESFGESVPYKLLATEPSSGTPEMALWADKFLGMQFHPELFPDSRPEKKQISEMIEKWVDGEINLLDKTISKKAAAENAFKKLETLVTSTTNEWNAATGQWATAFINNDEDEEPELNPDYEEMEDEDDE